jgi:hypothetical protein
MTTTLNASTAGAGGFIATSDNSGVLALQTASTTAITVDTSQNVGIGTSSPGTKLDVTGAIRSLVSGGNAILYLGNGSTQHSIQNPSGVGSPLTFLNDGTERMRIDSSGNLLVGRTSKQTDIASNPTNIQSGSGFSCYDGTQSASFLPTRIYFNGANGFYVLNASDTGVRLVNGATSWSAQSDERTKIDLVPIANGLEKINSLRAVTGRYTKDEEGVSRAFLIAQDVKAVLPEAVDEDTDEEKTLGLRYTDVIPLLVSAIKELKAINDTQTETINALTARIVALEGK